MKSLFTFFISVLLVSTVFAQRPEGVFAKATVAPEIDGVVDEVWSSATVYNIDKPYRLEVPTIGEPGESTWQGLWDTEGVYILLKVNDDDWHPGYEVPGSNNWEYDKPEIYFDVNYELEDGKGASGGAGHIQIAPGAVEGKDDGTPTTDTEVVYSFKVDGGAYVAEYFIPFTRLVDKDSNPVDVTNTIGFDVTIIDRDEGDTERRRMVWANVGEKDESWSNMDDAGHVTFEGAEPAVYVESITLNQGGTITTDNGTLQMTATVTPANATNKNVKWSVENGTGQAKIDANGLLTGLSNGTVTVKATAMDAGLEEAMTDVVISGQVLTQKDVWTDFNLITNGLFDNGLTGWGNWVDTGTSSPGQVAPVVQEGAVVMVPVAATDNAAWHYQLNQNKLQALPNVPYVLYFKSWASADGTPAVVDFEDISGNNYNRYGASADPEAVGGRSEWNYVINTTPQWYTFHVTFDQIVANTDQKVQYMISLSNNTIYLDSVLLVTQEMFDQLGSLPTNSKAFANSIDKVYPNPVGNGNTLFVELSAINSKVAIYNSVGQKLMEKTAVGSRVEFNVSSLRQGLYFVKTSDGSIVKFVR